MPPRMLPTRKVNTAQQSDCTKYSNTQVYLPPISFYHTMMVHNIVTSTPFYQICINFNGISLSTKDSFSISTI